jgi:hypothetical protein
MPDQPTLFDLFDATSLQNCRRQLQDGNIPTSDQLAGILEANASRPLPPWFTDLIAKSLRGELKRKPGRPKESLWSQCRLAAAKQDYHAWLNWLTRREKALGLGGWTVLRGKDWWCGPPHERAARIVTHRWRLHMSWRSFLNKISSEK